MTKYKLDQLFKDKLELIEVEPGDLAFQKFQNQIAGKKRPLIWFYIAASVSIILGVFIWSRTNNYEDSADMASLESNSPKTSDLIESNPEQSDPALISKSAPGIDASDLANPKVSDLKEVQGTVMIAEKKTIPVETVVPMPKLRELVVQEVVEKEVELANEEIPKLNLESGNTVVIAEATIEEETPEIIEQPLPKVKITYISGKKKRKSLLAEANITADSANVKDGTFNKILNSARNFANGSLIADLRDAKENFFNKNDD